GRLPRGARTLLPDRREREPAFTHQLPGEEGILGQSAVPAGLPRHCRTRVHVLQPLIFEGELMHFGIAIFPTEYAISPDDLAREVEQRGFESIWFPEHTHIPASRRTPWPGGGDLPREYWHTYDPFIALTAAASATTRLRLGTGICLVI